jgi:hypothetical protein
MVSALVIRPQEVKLVLLARSAKACLAALLAFATINVSSVRPAFAQAASEMGCDELWYARNQIYARNGYCFQTDRAISVFGRGCFPPYGKVYGGEQRRLNDIMYWERVKGC